MDASAAFGLSLRARARVSAGKGGDCGAKWRAKEGVRVSGAPLTILPTFNLLFAEYREERWIHFS